VTAVICWQLWLCVCVCETSLGGHFRALDQTCEDVFFLRGPFLGPWEIWLYGRLQRPRNAGFSKFEAGPWKWALLLQRVCVLNCVCDYTQVGWFVCCETSLGGHLRAMDQTCEDFFRSSENVSFCKSSQQYKNLYVWVSDRVWSVVVCVCVCVWCLSVCVCGLE